MLRRHDELLAKIEKAFGVDKHVIVAIWGVESSFGAGQGGRNILRSLASLAYLDKRRAPFWNEQLLAALKITANGDISPERMTGSWAGAMGHTQFMPTTYRAHAVDFDGDGRRDIWNSVPDALASTAAYLKASNWKPGLHWGSEVILPKQFDYASAVPDRTLPVIDWQARGVTSPDDRHVDYGAELVGMLLPAGNLGPAFFVSRNFKSILRYNNSELYALSVGYLADRLAGRPALTAAWPRHLKPLDKDQRIELQRLLSDRGLDTGGIDGILGGRSKIAIRSFQSAENLPADGFPNVKLLDRLRSTAKQGKKARQR